MPDYIFPFSNVVNLNEVLTSEALPFEYFNNLRSLQNDFTNARNNPLEHAESQIFDSEVRETTYYESEELNKLVQHNEFSMIFCNINSLSKNFDNFSSSVLNNPTEPTILAFCETKLNPDLENLHSLPNYNCVFNSKNSQSGGLVLYIKNNLTFKTMPEVTVMLEHLESLCVELIVGGCAVLLCIIYRRPGSCFDSFMLNYQQIVECIGNKKCLIFGDFNIDLLKYNNSNQVQTFVNFSFENSLTSFINKPTRITSNSATVIDHLWSNFNPELFGSGILMSDSSDHFAPFCYSNSFGSRHTENPENSVLYRNWKNICCTTLRDLVSSKLKDFCFESITDIDQSLNKLTYSIQESINELCPLKCFKKNKNFNSKPWLVPDLKALIKDKNKLYAKYCKKPLSFGNCYRSLRNRVNTQIKAAKINYFQNSLAQNNNNSKKNVENSR